MPYLVQVYDPNVYGGWRKLRGDNLTTKDGWDLAKPFGDVRNTHSAISSWCAEHPRNLVKYWRVINQGSGHVMWTDHPAGERGAPPNMENPIQLEKPLVLKRDAVIGKLESNLKKEQEKRAEAEQKEKDARNDFRQFCLDHEEQIVNYLRVSINGGSWSSALEDAERIFEKDEMYKTPESKPGRLENELEKFVRVLKMGAEDTIEVKPTQAVYDLL